MSQSTQAYNSSDGKAPIEVAVASNIRARVAQYYKEYWKLKQLNDFNKIYEEIKDDIGSFLNLYRLMKSEGMSVQHVIRPLKIANNN
jgi:hypothetical protein